MVAVPLKFLLDFVLFSRVARVYLLTHHQPNDPDSFLTLALEFVHGCNKPVQTVDQVGLAALCQTKQLDRVLVISGDDEADRFADCYGGDVTWLVISEKEAEVAAPARLRLDRNFYVASNDGTHHGIAVEEWYRIKQSKLIRQNIGFWTLGRGMKNVSPPDKLLQRRRDWRGTVLTVALIPNPPFVYIKAGQPLTGVLIDLFSTMGRKHNVTFEYLRPRSLADMQFGIFRNGSWTGLIGKMQRREVDVGGAVFALVAERADAASFVHSPAESKGCLIMVNPNLHKGKRGLVNWTALLRVFNPMAWAATLTAGIFVVLSYVLNQGYETINVGPCSLRFKLALELVLNGITFFLLNFVNMGSTLCVKMLSSKAFFVTVALSCYVFFSYFNAMLTSFMTAKAPAINIKSYHDVIGTDYQVIVTKGSSHLIDFMTAEEGTGRHAVYHAMIKDNPAAVYDSYSSARSAMLDNPKLVYSGTSITFWDDDRYLPLEHMSDAKTTYASFPLARDSEFLAMFNHYIVWVLENGISEALHSNWYGRRKPAQTCDCGNKEEAAPLGYENLMLPACVMGLGAVAAAALALWEKLLAKCCLPKGET